jgi:hypothetical protein
MADGRQCGNCGGTPEVPPPGYQLPVRHEPKPLINPLFEAEWLRYSALGVLVLGVLVFLGPTIVLPASVGKPLDFGPVVVASILLSLGQAALGLGVVSEWIWVTKRLYVPFLGVALVASLFLGFGDLANIIAFGAAGGAMVLVRILNTIALGVALFAANAVKRIPLD